VNKYFTIFLSRADDTFVGFEVKGVKTIVRACEDLGDVLVSDPFTVKDEDGEELDVCCMVKVAMFLKEEQPVREYLHDIATVSAGKKIRKRELIA
jgi:hypothetical protein